MSARIRGYAATVTRPPFAFAAIALVVALLGAGCAHSDPDATGATDIANRTTFGERTRGVAVFAAACATCHGVAGAGGIGPPLRDERDRKTYEATVAWIEAPAPPMPHLYVGPLSEQNVDDVATYVQSL